MSDTRLTHFDRIPEEQLREVTNQRIEQRAQRRAAAINAVQLSREHGGQGADPFSQNDADVIMAIMELLDRVAGG
jgi:hypothetical protein